MIDFEALGDKTIYFGHQSVGANIIQGVHEIVQPGALHLNIVHELIGQNGDPAGKCADFTRKCERFAVQPPDFALMKFCYVDFVQDSDPAALFRMYAQTLDSLKASYPSVTFVAVTAPLTTRSARWKRVVKAILGSSDMASVVNAKRVEFNTRVLAHFGPLVFDLARAESTRPNGQTTGDALADEYSDDGGHLNSLGRKAAAEGLLETLASISRR